MMMRPALTPSPVSSAHKRTCSSDGCRLWLCSISIVPFAVDVEVLMVWWVVDRKGRISTFVGGSERYGGEVELSCV